MSYLDTVQNKRRAAAAQTQTAAQRAAIMGQLQSIESATKGSNKQPVGLTARQQRLFDTVREVLEQDEVIQNTRQHEETLQALTDLKEALEDSKAASNVQAGDTQAAIDRLVGAVQAMELNPVINTPAPVVKVTEKDIDFRPLQATIREALLQQPAITLPDPAPDFTDLSRYRAQDITESGDRQYVGFMNPEGYWYIIENDTAQNRMRYVFGHGTYSKHFKVAPTFQYTLLDKAVRNAA